MTRKCRGFWPSVPCDSNCYKSSQYCRFHLWWLDHVSGVNRAIKETEMRERYSKGIPNLVAPEPSSASSSAAASEGS
jgi:hypothetical protein